MGAELGVGVRVSCVTVGLSGEHSVGCGDSRGVEGPLWSGCAEPAGLNWFPGRKHD